MLLCSIMIHYNIDLFLKSTLGINLLSSATHPSVFEWLDIRPFNTLIIGSNPIHITFKGTGRDLLIGTPSIFFGEISPFAIIHRKRHEMSRGQTDKRTIWSRPKWMRTKWVED